MYIMSVAPRGACCSLGNGMNTRPRRLPHRSSPATYAVEVAKVHVFVDDAVHHEHLPSNVPAPSITDAFAYPSGFASGVPM